MEPIQGFETSAFNNNQTPGKYPEELLSKLYDVYSIVLGLLVFVVNSDMNSFSYHIIYLLSIDPYRITKSIWIWK